jgi:murein L,D-transpeptidase YcbB/YkuD
MLFKAKRCAPVRWGRLVLLASVTMWLGGASVNVMAQPAVSHEAPAAASLSPDVVSALLEALRAAPLQGFGRDEFNTAEAERLLQSPDPTVHAQGEARLRAAVVAYARAQHGLRIPQASFLKEWAIRPAPYAAEADFDAALAGRRTAAWLRALPPSDPRYARLVTSYAHYQDLAARGGWPVLAGALRAGALRAGNTGPAVAALRRRLAIEDPAVVSPAESDSATALYDADLVSAVSRTQIRYGLTPDGVVGRATLAALNIPVERRLAQIRANLERWRWLSGSLPAYRAELNIADQSLFLHDSTQPDLAMRAIVGQPGKRTPMFQDHIRAVVLNPPWNVPADIAAKEIWPKIRKDRGYMAREGFVVRPDGSLQQLPGPKCALGNIKFDLSNPFGVYLHDTPARSLFAGDNRALSHGCMRLEQPNALAKRLLAGDADWPATRIDLAILGGHTERIALAQPVPLYVFYWTVSMTADGQINFRPDLYRWDEQLIGMLEAAAEPR